MAITGKPTFASFGLVPTAATIDFNNGEAESVNIGACRVQGVVPTANSDGQSPYIPVEGIHTDVRGASQGAGFITIPLTYSSPDNDIDTFNFPYAYLEIEGICAGVIFGGQPVHDFFRMTFHYNIIDLTGTYNLSPSSYVSYVSTAQAGSSIVSPDESVASYNGSSNNKSLNVRIAIVQGLTGLSSIFRYELI